MMFPIRTHDLACYYKDQVALDGLDLEVSEGSIFALVGPNGAGKTTTIKLLMHLREASGGDAEVLGCDVRRLGPAQFAQIGYVSENQKLPGWMTVEGFLRYLRPFYPTWDEATEDELVRQFDLPRSRKLQDLSHGMWMKAAMASALAYHPKLLVLDEPFTGLDPLIRDELLEGLLPRAENTTILISSHDLAEIESFATHIGFLDRGRLQFAEELTTLVARFREVEVTLGAAPAAAPRWPKSWLNAEHCAGVFRFVDSEFDQERTTAAIERLFGHVDGVAANPMPLRSIFVTLAKAARKAA